MEMIKRVESGILGLDNLIQGGFVEGSTNLIAGTTGTGKTIFCMQYILHGLRKSENGLYITLEQGRDDIINDVASFGWGAHIKKGTKDGKMVLYPAIITNVSELYRTIIMLIKKHNIKRFVLDSLTVASMGWKETESVTKIRSELLTFLKNLKNSGVTSLLITEIPEDKEKALSRFGFEEFLADSVIILHYLEYATTGTPRSLIIRKMRRTDHKTDIYPVEITKTGLKVSLPKKGIVL